MDALYVQGLREAKALLDDGILTQEEFNEEKLEMTQQREERKEDKDKKERSKLRAPQTHSGAGGEVLGALNGMVMGASGPPHPPPTLPALTFTPPEAYQAHIPGTKRSREDSYTVPPGLRHALKPLSKMPGRETMSDARVRCAICTQKGSVYCLECSKFKASGVYALCCPSSGRLCACIHWSDMVSGHGATWLPHGTPPRGAETVPCGRRSVVGAGGEAGEGEGKAKGTGKPRGRFSPPILLLSLPFNFAHLFDWFVVCG